MSELVRVVGKAMLLHLPQLVQQPGFSALWVAVLNSLAAAAAAGPEGLNDASAAALQNLIIMLHEMVSGQWDSVGWLLFAGRRAARACACSLLTMLPCPHSHLLCRHTSSKHGTTGVSLVLRAGFVFSLEGGERVNMPARSIVGIACMLRAKGFVPLHVSAAGHPAPRLE